MEDNLTYRKIEQAIKYLSTNFKKQPTLDEVAEYVHLSPFHFQRLFSSWAGISPKKFLQFITLEELKKDLYTTRNLSDVAEKAGLSSQSRVYDLFVNIESMTPEEYKKMGKGLKIEYGIHSTPFGNCIVAMTDKGVCSLNFFDEDEVPLFQEIKAKWPFALWERNQERTAETIHLIFGAKERKSNLNLFLKGTPFQIKVWEALLKIPFGTVSCYRKIADDIGMPNANRAVGSAIGDNPVGYIIPCHRVIRSEGVIGQYHWGVARKSAMIGWEKAKINV